MNKGLSLVEFLVSITISSVLILALVSMNILSARSYAGVTSTWYCLQSLRNTLVTLDTDLAQCGCLMPQDLKIAPAKDQLFIAGLPHTSSHPGLKVPGKYPPPLYSVVLSSNEHSLLLDTVDIDLDSVPDYWADLGIITDSGPSIVTHTYSRGNTLIPLTSGATASVGDRIVPAIHYELRSDGLYRNGQLMAEAIKAFDAVLSGNILTINLQAGYHGTLKDISYPFVLR